MDIPQVKRLKEINENAEQAGDLLGASPGDSLMVSAIKQRSAASSSRQPLTWCLGTRTTRRAG